MRRLIVIMFAMLAMTGCSAPSPPARAKPTIRLAHVHPLPQASVVRLFVETGKYDRSGNARWNRSKGRTLSATQRQQFEALLHIETPVNVPPDDDYWLTTACFIPHHFFRYYNSSGRQLGEVAVCFCCSGVEIEPESALRLRDQQRFAVDFTKLEALVASWGERTDIACD